MPKSALFLGAIPASARFVAAAWREAWAALLLAGLAIAGAVDAMAGGAGTSWAGAWLGLTGPAILIAQGALYRSTFGRPGLGPGGFQWGAVEMRLLAVWLLTAGFLFILGLLAFVTLLCCAYAVASAGPGFVAADPATWAAAIDPRGRSIVGAVALAGAGALIWAKVRISLASAATVARGRVQVLSAWPMTRGAAGPILAAGVVTSGAPGLLLAALIFLGRRLASGSLGAGAVTLSEGVVVAGLWLPMTAGLMAYLYRRLDPAAPASPSLP